MYTLDGQPKTVKEAVDCMHFYHNSPQGSPPQHDVVRAVTLEEDWAKCVEKEMEIYLGITGAAESCAELREGLDRKFFQ